MVNVTPKQLGKNVRMNFGKINEVLDMPNLIEVQINSYNWFREVGLKDVFQEFSSITDYNGNLVLNFIDYKFDSTPKYTIAECKERDVTYAAPLRVTATLWNKEYVLTLDLLSLCPPPTNANEPLYALPSESLHVRIRIAFMA